MASPSSAAPLPPSNVEGTQQTPASPTAAATQAAASSGGAESVSSMADLKEKAPDVYQAMLQGIGMNICRKMEDHQKRLKKIHEEARRSAGGG